MESLLQALLLGIVEGVTEFLPISSTGHLILAGDLLDFRHPGRDVFYIAIQTGAMLAVVWEYRARFFSVDAALYRNLAVAFVPAALLGFFFSGLIKHYLFHPVPVALAFIVGGIIILLVDRGERNSRVKDTQSMTWLDALKVGVAQCFALIPGTSRSGATIIGAMLFGFSRHAATADIEGIGRVWDLNGNCLKELRGHEDEIWAIAFAPDDSYIVTGSLDKTIRIWRNALRDPFADVPHSGAIISAVPSPDGSAPQPVTTFAYDYRGRRTSVKS